ncbi:MAG TPA: GLPGLI family protein [Chitinophagaceae bacterium]|nr:GLPGLI family protein [Chitinophagaceae bacterium]
MKRSIITLFVLATINAGAQQFINSGMIEFEVRTNNHKVFGDGIFAEMFKDKMPQFSTTWYDFTFDNNKSVYKFDRRDEKTKLPWSRGEEEDNIWYNNYNAGTFVQQKFVFDNTYLLNDSLLRIDWKLVPNETREIAGFNCRKAVGIIFDSVYVFAFYTDEIMISGGPMGINGLPGMILGITIPRMYTSWIATKLQVNGVNTAIITEPQKGKKKKAAELQESVKKATSDWGSWGQQAVWNIFL